MRILLDGRILREPAPTGVARSLRTLLRGLASQPGDHVVRLANAPAADVEGLGSRVVGGGRLGRLRTPGPSAGDVLLSPVTALPPFGPLPRIATIHDLPWLSGVRGERREWRQRLRTRLTRRIADAIIVPSEATRNALLRLRAPGPPIQVVPPGLHPDVRLDPGADARDRAAALLAGRPRPYLLAVGAVRRRKGLPVLLRAHDALRGRRPGTLVLVGPGTCALARRESTVAVGWVDDATLRALMDAADVLVHPALLEGFGLAPLEAMARGTPVVAARSPGLEEAVGDGARLCSPGDERALAEGIEEVLDDPGLREAIVARGRARADLRTPEAHAAGVLRVCREVCG